MENQSDRLLKIGLEGFALIDEFYGRRPRRLPVVVVPRPQQLHQGPINQQALHVKEKTMVLDSSEAARKYGGIVQCYYYPGHGGNAKPRCNLA